MNRNRIELDPGHGMPSAWDVDRERRSSIPRRAMEAAVLAMVWALLVAGYIGVALWLRITRCSATR